MWAGWLSAHAKEFFTRRWDLKFIAPQRFYSLTAVQHVAVDGREKASAVKLSDYEPPAGPVLNDEIANVEHPLGSVGLNSKDGGSVVQRIQPEGYETDANQPDCSESATDERVPQNKTYCDRRDDGHRDGT
jgi:hypothetical protein